MRHKLKIALSQIKTPAFLYVDAFHTLQITQFIQKIGDAPILIYYSVKTNDATFVLEKIATKVAGMEVITARELELVQSWPQVKNIIINGPCKTEAFLNSAITQKAYLYIDNEDEFRCLERILKEKKQCIDVGLRLMYGNSPHKFGINPHASFYQQLIEENAHHPYIKITGLHSHMSHYEETYQQFHTRLSRMKKEVERCEKNGLSINSINIGGGFKPVVRLNHQMTWEHNDDFDKKIKLLEQVFLSYPSFLKEKSLIVEPGRALSEGSIVGVGEIITIKQVHAITYIFIDFSTAFAGGSHPAESCIQMMLLKKKTNQLFPLYPDPKSHTMLCGPLCSGNDNFGFYSGKNFTVGDRIILLNAGAYSLSFRWHGPDTLPELTYFNEE